MEQQQTIWKERLNEQRNQPYIDLIYKEIWDLKDIRRNDFNIKGKTLDQHLKEGVLTEEEKIKTLLHSAILAESIARYCLIRLLTTKTLQPYFENEAAIDSFWNLNKINRKKIWGDIFDLTTFSHQHTSCLGQINMDWFD